jgi:hypothetical protein
MQSRYISLVFGLVAVACTAAACDGDSEDSSCIAGERRACTCMDGSTGLQDCADSGGAWLACDCSGGPEGGAGGQASTSTAGAQNAGGSSNPTLIDPGCNDAFTAFEAETPTVLLLVDRSSSMFDQTFTGSDNRWDATQAALVGSGGVITNLEQSISFGLATFTHQQANGEAQCPQLGGLDAGFALGNATALSAVLDAAAYNPIDDGGGSDTAYKGETPTGAAVEAAAARLAPVAAAGPTYLVLITDGMPDTCGLADPQCGQDAAIAAVQGAHAQGIETRVVGVALSEAEETNYLQQLANAGVGEPVVEVARPADCDGHEAELPGGGASASYSASAGSAPFEQAGDADALATSMARTVQGLRSCTVTLTDTIVDPTSASLGQVQLLDRILTYGDANGWALPSPTQVELTGTACADFRAASGTPLLISFPCD